MESDDEVMEPSFMQRPSTTAAQTIQVNRSFLGNTLRLVKKYYRSLLLLQRATTR